MISWQEYDAITAVTQGVDEIARSMETKWGVGRLPLLVSNELREKFSRQLRRFDEAIEANDVERVRQTGEATKRAWLALNSEATNTNQQILTPDVWETRVETRVVAICRTNAEAHALVRSGRCAEVWTLDEIARILAAYPGLGEPKTFPGNLVKTQTPKTPEQPGEDDEW